MGKWTDKLYITHSEWTGEVGQHSASSGTLGRTRGDGFRRLPFSCCALSLQPFENPMCTPDGIIFDLVNIIPYIKKHGTNPVTGEKLAIKDLIKLNFVKNNDGKYHCPVSFKVFSDHTAIAAIKTTGNVFALDTIERLNFDTKHFKDLLTDEPFKKSDIIILQDPHNLDKKDMSTFHYAKNNLSHLNEAEEREKRKPINNINVKSIGGTASRIFAELQSNEDAKDGSASSMSEGTSPASNTVAKVNAPSPSDKPSPISKSKPKTPYNAAHFSTGAVSQSFTSTAMDTATVNEKALINEDEFMYKKIKKKAYVTIETNFGKLNVELHCDKAPRTCHNFVELANSGYYNGVLFHRNVPGFMIQGGDPTGTGKGGESIWKAKFPDELKNSLSHDKEGVLSMANSGKDTNGSQFFITYQACKNLDKLHTVFGRVVGGLSVLKELEAIPTDSKDRPIRSIRMKDVSVLVDPYKEYKERLGRRLLRESTTVEDEAERRKIQAKKDKMGWFGPRIETKQSTSTKRSVGKYLQQASTPSSQFSTSLDDPPAIAPKKQKKNVQKSYGNFDNF